MLHNLLRLTAAAMAVLILTGAALHAADRSDAPEKEKWNLSEIYPSDAAWFEAKENIAARIPEVEAFKGKLGSSSKALLNCMELLQEISKDFGRLRPLAQLRLLPLAGTFARNKHLRILLQGGMFFNQLDSVGHPLASRSRGILIGSVILGAALVALVSARTVAATWGSANAATIWPRLSGLGRASAS